MTHRCHKREFLLKFDKDKNRWIHWLFEAKKRMVDIMRSEIQRELENNEEYYKAHGLKLREDRKRLRRVFRIIKQA